ncbi:MAG TPA: hypothetical protein VM243_15055 [Phycisphaerae bacterium]|nr:hypothetical protein [Phycisphaerae bacterium]
MKARIALIGFLAIWVAACQTTSAPGGSVGTGVTFIDGVEVVERSGEYWAVVAGSYPDACSSYGGSEQEVAGETIELAVTSQSPDDAVCAQVRTAMTEKCLSTPRGSIQVRTRRSSTETRQ